MNFILGKNLLSRDFKLKRKNRFAFIANVVKIKASKCMYS